MLAVVFFNLLFDGLLDVLFSLSFLLLVLGDASLRGLTLLDLPTRPGGVALPDLNLVAFVGGVMLREADLAAFLCPLGDLEGELRSLLTTFLVSLH